MSTTTLPPFRTVSTLHSAFFSRNHLTIAGYSSWRMEWLSPAVASLLQIDKTDLNYDNLQLDRRCLSDISTIMPFA
jgi:hypothetical protein